MLSFMGFHIGNQIGNTIGLPLGIGPGAKWGGGCFTQGGPHPVQLSLCALALTVLTTHELFVNFDFRLLNFHKPLRG